MSILNEREILHRLLVTRDVVVTPIIDLATQLGPTSLDVRLGTRFQAQKRSALAYIEPLQEPEAVRRDVAEYTQDYTVLPTEPYVLASRRVCPGQYAGVHPPARRPGGAPGRTQQLGPGAACRSTPRQGSSIRASRAPSPSSSPISARYRFPLYPGLRIGQLSFYTSAESVIPYRSKRLTKYAGKIAPVGSAFYQDPEYRYIRRQRERERERARRPAL